MNKDLINNVLQIWNPLEYNQIPQDEMLYLWSICLLHNGCHFQKQYYMKNLI